MRVVGQCWHGAHSPWGAVDPGDGCNFGVSLHVYGKRQDSVGGLLSDFTGMTVRQRRIGLAHFRKGTLTTV